MIASAEDAHLLFARWMQHAPPVRIRLMSATVILEAVGTVTGHSSGSLQLAGPSWQVTVPLEGAAFTFSDPREIPVASVREAETARYEFGLAIEQPTGDRIALMELKGGAPPEDPAE